MYCLNTISLLCLSGAAGKCTLVMPIKTYSLNLVLLLFMQVSLEDLTDFVGSVATNSIKRRSPLAASAVGCDLAVLAQPWCYHNTMYLKGSGSDLSPLIQLVLIIPNY
jgi:hypothetical protein